MLDLTIQKPALPAMSDAAIEKSRAVEAMLLAQPQFDLDMQHVLHAGLYSRTVRVPAGVAITGVLIKIPTLVVVQGDVIVWLGDESQRLTGYAVLPASAGRKQVFIAIADTCITMIFPTEAKTVEEAERQFTDEAEHLAPGRSETIVTGEQACRV